MYKVEGAEVIVHICNQFNAAHKQTSCNISEYFRMSPRLLYMQTKGLKDFLVRYKVAGGNFLSADIGC